MEEWNGGMMEEWEGGERFSTGGWKFSMAWKNFPPVDKKFPWRGKSPEKFSMAWKTVAGKSSCGKAGGRGSLSSDEVFDFGEELGGVAESAVYGDVAEEGDFVEFFELVEDLAADDGGGDFAVVLGFDFVDDVVDEDVELGVGDGALDGGARDGGAELVAVELLVAAVALDDGEGGLDDFLVGGEAVGAGGADAPAADDVAAADGAGIDDLVVVL